MPRLYDCWLRQETLAPNMCTCCAWTSFTSLQIIKIELYL